MSYKLVNTDYGTAIVSNNKFFFDFGFPLINNLLTNIYAHQTILSGSAADVHVIRQLFLDTFNLLLGDK